ncbi:CBS domain-containing protein [Mesorhizobium sp. PAMC28654]|uniref:CBS domain-containing protein n=1 Tax=Mesorhizobium sp. PAMC28654 TaxID=2880934 RepID=UPI001D0AA2CD|nr:CBS domain-containing protein [Mesorhizobium sp. PAMC28654]UDL90414.1 CBS domain-containing protein [Mesorhizobium sp. PAMC28654]
MQVQAVMTSPVIGIEPSASIADAARLMLSRKISGLPVIRGDGTLVGIISEGDFLRRIELDTKRTRSRWLEFLLSPGKAANEYVHANGQRVDEVMSNSVVTTTREASLVEVVELMARHNVKRLPVMEDGKVVGIIARSDLLRALLRVLPAQGSTDVSDEQIRQNILAELASQTWARNSLVRVNVDKGVAELSGPIFDERERQAALVAAENIAGVKAVTDHLLWVDPLSGMMVDPLA